jgi:hypothetical protein
LTPSFPHFLAVGVLLRPFDWQIHYFDFPGAGSPKASLEHEIYPVIFNLLLLPFYISEGFTVWDLSSGRYQTVPSH